MFTKAHLITKGVSGRIRDSYANLYITVLYCFYKIFLENNSRKQGKCCLLHDFLDTLSYFLPANQDAHLKTQNQSKFL